MEEQQPTESVIPKAPFPAPPPFWRHFTTENIARLDALEAAEQDPAQPLPLELTYLRAPPPPPPTLDSYTTFSQPQPLDTKPVLPPADQLLFDPSQPTNHAVLLTRMTKSLLLNFLELITVLGQDPTQHAEKMEDIRKLMVNVHAVINMYRPHQARESVKEMLEGMLEDGRREIEEYDRVKGQVEDFLAGLSLQKDTVDPQVGGVQSNGTSRGHQGKSTDEEKKLEETERLWKLVHEIGDE